MKTYKNKMWKRSAGQVTAVGKKMFMFQVWDFAIKGERSRWTVLKELEQSKRWLQRGKVARDSIEMKAECKNKMVVVGLGVVSRIDPNWDYSRLCRLFSTGVKETTQGWKRTSERRNFSESKHELTMQTYHWLIKWSSSIFILFLTIFLYNYTT